MARGMAKASIELIESCSKILSEIQPASVRAVCYRLFTMGFIPDMSKASVGKVGRLLVLAREEGRIPWEWIVDETREAERAPVWEDPEDYTRYVNNIYRRDLWASQDRQVEVWSEKGTIRGTLSPVLYNYGVTLRVFHGFSSATAIYDVAKDTHKLREPLLAFYVGDWDPSGLSMSEVDLPRRLVRYSANVELRRVALTEEQTDIYDLPSFEAKTKRGDPRFKWFRKKYGKKCYELDALSPNVLRQVVRSELEEIIDEEKWLRMEIIEKAEKESLEEVMDAWKGLPKKGRNLKRHSLTRVYSGV